MRVRHAWILAAAGVVAVLASAAALALVRGNAGQVRLARTATGSPRSTQPACGLAYARARCASADPLACAWAELLDAPDDDRAILTMVGEDVVDVDSALRRLFPQLEGKPLVDEPLPVPAPPTYHFESDPPYVVTMPIDWTADPYGHRSWRSNYQNLGWLHTYVMRGGADLDTAAYVLVDWAQHALGPDSRFEWTWYDAGMARRLERVAELVDRYISERTTVNRRVVIAAARTIASHLYAMSTDACYAAHSNHGMMQDLALVKFVRTFPAIRHADTMWRHSRDRLVTHVATSVTAEGIHYENSPEYQVMYLRLVIEAIAVFESLGEAPPAELFAARDGMQAALIYQLQPNLTLPQFGDSTNNGPVRVIETAAAARTQQGNVAILDQLDWVLGRGATGTMPSQLDRVFVESGYAAFRQRWDAADPAAAITGHFKCGKLSKVHYHADDTSFEIYGHGSELIVDTGKYSYQYDDPFVIHQYDVRAHNVLVIDDAPFLGLVPPHIVAHQLGAELSWVQGVHDNYASRGISSQARTFAYARPDTFIIVDHVRAAEPHDYAQHFHLHPSLSEVTVIDDHTVVARSPGGGPALVLSAGEAPTRIDIVRGHKDADVVQGWYFPGWTAAEPTADVIFVYDQRSGPVLMLPMVVAVGAPGAAPPAIAGVTIAAASGQFTVGWQRDGAARSISVPEPTR